MLDAIAEGCLDESKAAEEQNFIRWNSLAAVIGEDSNRCRDIHNRRGNPLLTAMPGIGQAGKRPNWRAGLSGVLPALFPSGARIEGF